MGAFYQSVCEAENCILKGRQIVENDNEKIINAGYDFSSLQCYSQVKITEILGYEYNNQKNTFSPNVVGKESSAIDGSGQQTMVVVKLNTIPGAVYKYISRKLKVTALY